MNSPGHDNPAAETPIPDAAALRDATERLLATARRLDDTAVHGPSRLPGWTRGHVLAHLARNADALVNVLSGRPMYPGDAVRDGDIERDAPRTAAEHLTDVRASAERLDAAFAEETDTGWQRTVELRNGVTDLAASVPFRRWIEVELHHVDLGAGYTLDDLPAAFVERETDNMARRFAGHPDLAEAVELRTEDGRSWRTGVLTGDDPVVVVGTPAALTGWLTGRTTGSGLSASGPLPALPPL